MELPFPLRHALDAATEGFDHARLARAATRIRQRYMADAADGTSLVRDEDEALAYAITRMPATFGACYCAISALMEGLSESPKTLLDVGAGTGAATWAAAELLALERITCLEREGAMRALGERLMRGAEGMDGEDAGTASDDAIGGDVAAAVAVGVDRAFRAVASARWRDGDIRALTAADRADLVIAGYVLGEMTGADRRQATLRLWQAAGKALVILEPGTPAGYRRILEMRGALVEAGAHIVAPCPVQGLCPLPQEDWCHFTCRVPRSRLHRRMKAGDAPYEDEKFIYIAAAREAATAAEARVLRHPVIRPGNIELRLCTARGLSRVTVTKKDGERFRRARKAAAGDAFPAD